MCQSRQSTELVLDREIKGSVLNDGMWCQHACAKENKQVKEFPRKILEKIVANGSKK